MEPKPGPWVPFNFLALPDDLSRLETARVVILPVPYDATTSFRGGARNGPRAIIESSYNLEDYDPELETDVSQVGIHTAAAVEPHMAGPLHMIQRVHDAVASFARQDKLLAMLGGEHSISVGSVRALKEIYPDLSVLYLDAHADLRDEYMGTPWGHASVARRIQEQCQIVLVGVRSMSQEEHQFLSGNQVPLFPCSLEAEVVDEAEHIIDCLSPNVYISVDLDVLDPAIMSAVGTPEPGGMSWASITGLIKLVAKQRKIVGFDVTELSPEQGPTACSYTAAKLVYKLIGYSQTLPGAGTTAAARTPGSIGE